MKSNFALVASALCLICSTGAAAQANNAVSPEASAPQIMVISAEPVANTVLPQGTSVRLRLLSQLHSQENRTGDRFELEVAEDVMLGGVTVIPRGSPASGEITRVKRKGMWGRSGRLETRLLSVRANGVNIPITGTVADRGETGTAGVIASIAVLPVAGFFVTGTSAIMPVGTGFTGHTDSDIPVVMPARVAPAAIAAQSMVLPQPN